MAEEWAHLLLPAATGSSQRQLAIAPLGLHILCITWAQAVIQASWLLGQGLISQNPQKGDQLRDYPG
jgi:hypothetical protein